MTNHTSKQLNHRLTLRIVELVLITILASAALRHFFIELPGYFLAIQIVNCIVVISVYAIVRLNKLPQWEAIISLLAGLIVVLPVFMITGGVNSQYSSLLPLFPIVAILIGGRFESLIMGVVLSTITILCTTFSDHIIDLTGNPSEEGKSSIRGIWLTITIVFSTIFGRFFLQKYNEVTEQLIEENTQDPLTGLLNRRGFNLQFNHELNKAINQSKSLCLLLIDVDYFKKINDQHGHDIGDACLIEVGNVLTSNIRKNDIIARFGGEEFTIILPNTDLASARKVAEKLNKSISNKVFSEFKLPLTITLGLTSLHGPQDNELKMIKRADKALYKGKDNGRNCVEILE